MASPYTLGGLIIREWIDGNSIERSLHLLTGKDIVNLDFAEELYISVLEVFTQLQKSQALTSSNPKDRRVNEAVAILHLWGRDFRDGKLACVLAQSDDLRESIICLLAKIGKIVLELAITRLDHHGESLAEQVRDLRGLLARSRLIVTDSDASGSESGDEEHELYCAVEAKKGKEHLNLRTREDRSYVRDLEKRLADVGRELEQYKSQISLSQAEYQESDEISETSDDEPSDYGELLECYLECLMELVPTIEQTLAHAEFGGFHKAAKRKPFVVTELARPFVQNVADKFTKADDSLVERLGVSNWQRYTTICARLENPEAPHAQILETVPNSVFTPLSLFHDSGLGSSVPGISRYAASGASHTSFVSSLAKDGSSNLRVPPTPKEVGMGEPFKCEICAHVLYNICNRVDWKIHVFTDLQPYICSFNTCAKGLVMFPTRKLWAEHEFSEHRIARSWKCTECTGQAYTTAYDFEEHLHQRHGEAITMAQMPFVVAAAETKTPLPIDKQECPLCKIVPGKSRRNFTTHVGRHMESVALAVIPRETEEDSECSSVVSDVAEDLVLNKIEDQRDENLATSNYSGDKLIDSTTTGGPSHVTTEVEDLQQAGVRHRSPSPYLPPTSASHQQRSVSSMFQNDDDHAKDVRDARNNTRCLCGNIEYSGNSIAFNPDGTVFIGSTLIQCDECKVWQHGVCVGIISREDSPTEYFCELCREDLHDLQTSDGQTYSRYTPASTIEKAHVSSAPSVSSLGERQLRQSRLLEHDQQGALEIAPLRQQVVLTCPFIFLQCLLSFTSVSEWVTHSLTHFKEIMPPNSNQCCFCDKTFKRADGQQSWREKLEHTALHYQEGHKLPKARPDFELHKYLWENCLIDNVEYKDLYLAEGLAPHQN
ncbi:hypothetical protein MMC13_007781 [Lambiella insularis]|nr:hypothetical protein [Lambiella insularis]